jgi:hypothetical protein
MRSYAQGARVAGTEPNGGWNVDGATTPPGPVADRDTWFHQYAQARTTRPAPVL